MFDSFGYLCSSLALLCFGFRITRADGALKLFVPASPVFVENKRVLILNISYTYSGTETLGITWQKKGDIDILVRRLIDGRIKRNDNRVSIINDGDLALNKTKLSDNGTYEVEFDTGLKKYSKDITIIVLEQPNAHIRCPFYDVINENDNFSCLCNTSGGNPPPYVVWLKNGEKITSKGFLQQYLTITNASKNDSGIYICKATSHTLSDTDEMRILVAYKPIIVSFTINSTSKYVERGSSVLFTCKVDAYPSASVKLYHNGSEIGYFNNGKYIINAVSSVHNGNYQCVAENLLGKTKSHEVVVEVAERPKASSHCTNTKTKINEHGKISCTCGGGNNVPIAEAWWIDNKGSKVTPGSLLNQTLDREDDGTWTCHVRSYQNLTDKITIFIKVIYPTTLPTTVVIVSSTKATKGDKNNLDDNNDGRVDWYIAVITFLCGLLVGAVVTYVVIKLRHRVTKQRKQQQNNNMYDDVIPSEAQPPVYQELNLKDMNQPENYQALKRDVGGGGRSNNGLDVKDSNYQELNNPRGRSADNYQTLQKT